MFALVDCNNFFASCEKIFDPSLDQKPVIILSNNDGCIIARSNEAKALGIPMGAPYFKWKNIIEKNKVKVFSSNYELYGDISNRIMSIISDMAKDYEIYSIDEAFISLQNIPNNKVIDFVINIQSRIFKWVGIRVSIGIGSSKTLAKAANFIAKKKPMLCIYDNIFDLRDSYMQDQILTLMNLDDIWGISFRLREQLEFINIKKAKDLRDFDSKIIRNNFSVILEKIIMELRGVSCIGIENYLEPKKNIMASRSFGRVITSITQLEEALSNHVARASIKLRKQGSKASGIYVMLKTNKFRKKKSLKGNSDLLSIYKYGKSLYFTKATSNTSTIIKYAKSILKDLYIENLEYKKVGIILLDCKDSSFSQKSFFEEEDDSIKDNIMNIIDKANNKFGKGKIYLAAEGTNSTKSLWQMKRNRSSPNYTCNWLELPRIK